MYFLDKICIWSIYQLDPDVSLYCRYEHYLSVLKINVVSNKTVLELIDV